MGFHITFLVAITAPLWWLMMRDFRKGLAFGVFLLISLTTYIRIELPGALPELTLHRWVLINLVIGRLTQPLRGKVPDDWRRYLKFFAFYAVANFLALTVTTIEFTQSLKRYLDFVLEVIVFYVLVGSTLRHRDDALRMIHAAWLALVFVALMATVEKYTGFNWCDRYIPGYQRLDQERNDVMATYPHRILLGTGLAMGWGLGFGLLNYGRPWFPKQRVMFVASCLLLASCYFSMSRGPWLAAMVAFIMMAVFTSNPLRVRMGVIVTMCVLTLIIRPGVWETLKGLAEDTVDTDSHKGGTFQYRMELWKIAYRGVSVSPTKFLFGNGPGAGTELDVVWELSYRGKDRKIESWDNQLAYDLFQSGFVGLAATVFLYFSVGLNAVKLWWWALKRKMSKDRELLAGIISAMSAYGFMMTNVLIFSKQLHFLFWTLVAASLVLLKPTEAELKESESEDGDADLTRKEAEARPARMGPLPAHG